MSYTPFSASKTEAQTENEKESSTTLSEITALLQTLQSQCDTLLAELDAFQAHLKGAPLPPSATSASDSDHIADLRSSLSTLSVVAPTATQPEAPAKSITIPSPQVEFRQFKSSITSEQKSLLKAAKGVGEQWQRQRSSCAARRRSQDQDGEDDHNRVEENEEAEEDLDLEVANSRTLHTLRSSNLPFYAAVWETAKRSCSGVVAIGKRFYWDVESCGSGSAVIVRGGWSHGEIMNKSHGGRRGGTGVDTGLDAAANGKRKTQRSALVDIVAADGEEWVKVSTVTETRLLFDMAKQGWERGYDSGSGSDEDEQYGAIGQGHKVVDEEEDDRIELVRLAEDLSKASKSVRVRYKHPRVRFILPKIIEGHEPAVDGILADIRKTGAIVQCGGGNSTNGHDSTTVNGHTSTTAITASLAQSFTRMQPNPHVDFTSTLNVDCTLLLALVSDLSHRHHIPPSPTHHRAIQRQIELEKTSPLIPTEIWPAISGRNLVCTTQAAKRMHEIVELIGTEDEKARTVLLMGVGDTANLSPDAILSKFKPLSDHVIPATFTLPIKTINPDPTITSALSAGTLPPEAMKIASHLSAINASVFLYGWASENMTVSSNRTVAKQVEALVEEYGRHDDADGRGELRGPKVWICGTARSLVGKEKGRKD